MFLVWFFFLFVLTPSEGSLPALFSLLSLHRLLLPFHNLSSCLVHSSALSCTSPAKVDYLVFPRTSLGLVTDRAVREELQQPWCSWWCRAWVTWSRPRALALFVAVCIYFSLGSNRNLPAAHQTWSHAGFITPDSWLGFLQEKCQFVKLVLALVCCLVMLLYSGACLLIHHAALSWDLRTYLKSLNIALLALR